MGCPYKMLDEQGKDFTPPVYPLRFDLPEPPAKMAHLPKDDRGYPVPFFVAWPGMKPEFRASSRQAVALCIQRSLCWVCGSPLNGERTFTIGPMCAINRVSSEPPAHRDCARYSAIACPFLSKPQMVRRENDLPGGIELGAGTSIRRNPGVTLLWFARGFKAERYPQGYLWHFTTEPVMTEWYCRGRRATRQEVLDSIEAGMPALVDASRIDGSEAMLAEHVKRGMRLLPRKDEVR